MILLLYIALLIAVYYLGYIISLYSSTAYLESEELEYLAEQEEGLRKKYLMLLIEKPRLIIQLAMVFKSFVLVAASLLAVLISAYTDEGHPLPFGAATGLSLLAVWLMYLLFVEFLPRRRVLKSSEKDFMRYLALFAIVYVFFKPFIALYGKVLPVGKRQKITDDMKEDLIERAIESLAEQSGVDEEIIDEEEKEMIGQIFQLDVTEVREVMVPRVNIKGIEKKATLEEVRDMTRDSGFSRYPVYDETIDKILGILYVKDLFTDSAAGHGSFEVTNYMREAHFVSETMIISELMEEFQESKVHIAVVADEYGGTSGLVTLEDILEEIVGEIRDEHDVERDPLIKLPDNSYRVDPNMLVEEFIEELEIDHDNSEFETVGGLIYDIVGSVPSAGAKIKWKDVIFEVEQVEGQRIKVLKAWLKKPSEG